MTTDTIATTHPDEVTAPTQVIASKLPAGSIGALVIYPRELTECIPADRLRSALTAFGNENAVNFVNTFSPLAALNTVFPVGMLELESSHDRPGETWLDVRLTKKSPTLRIHELVYHDETEHDQTETPLASIWVRTRPDSACALRVHRDEDGLSTLSKEEQGEIGAYLDGLPAEFEAARQLVYQDSFTNVVEVLLRNAGGISLTIYGEESGVVFVPASVGDQAYAVQEFITSVMGEQARRYPCLVQPMDNNSQTVQYIATVAERELRHRIQHLGNFTTQLLKKAERAEIEAAKTNDDAAAEDDAAEGKPVVIHDEGTATSLNNQLNILDQLMKVYREFLPPDVHAELTADLAVEIKVLTPVDTETVDNA